MAEGQFARNHQYAAEMRLRDAGFCARLAGNSWSSPEWQWASFEWRWRYCGWRWRRGCVEDTFISISIKLQCITCRSLDDEEEKMTEMWFVPADVQEVRKIYRSMTHCQSLQLDPNDSYESDGGKGTKNIYINFE